MDYNSKTINNNNNKNTNMGKFVFSKQRSFSFGSLSPKFSLFCLITFSIILIISQTFSLRPSSPSTPSLQLFTNTKLRYLIQKLKLIAEERDASYIDGVPFYPLKDVRYAKTAVGVMDGNTWFMSRLSSTHEDGEAEHVHFPSPETGHQNILCISGRNRKNGANNSYAVVHRRWIPASAKLLHGLTFISDTYYDYDNLWHGLASMAPFFAWHQRKGCVLPARWVLYHRGELRDSTSSWLHSISEAVFGRNNVKFETFEGTGEDTPVCFEEAVVFRRNEGEMKQKRKEAVYDMLRCKARAYCGISQDTDLNKNPATVRMTLLLRTGTRAFKDDPAMISIFGRECGKVHGCRLRVARPTNLSFCDQVKLMSETDLLVSSHGAQMTNMFFMDKNSSVMEFFPKGWLELAGAGQYVFRWIANGAGIRHKGAWNDPNGDTCPESNKSKCFPFYKNRNIGHNETFFANWTAAVLKEMKAYKVEMARRRFLSPVTTNNCPCE